MPFTAADRNKPDTIGTVRIYIYRVERQQGKGRKSGPTSVKGNVVKAITVNNAKVTSVAKAIRQALFEE